MPILLDSTQTRAPLQFLIAVARKLVDTHDPSLYGAMVAVHGAFPFRLDKPLRNFEPDTAFSKSFALPFTGIMQETLDIEPLLSELSTTVACALLAEDGMRELIGKNRPMLVLSRTSTLFTSVTCWPDRGTMHRRRGEKHPLTQTSQVLVAAVNLELALLDKELWTGGAPEDF